MSKPWIESEHYPLMAAMLARSASVMLCITNSEKERVFLNDSWLAFTGKTLEEELEYGWASSIHPDDAHHCTGVFDHAFANKINYKREKRLQ